MRENSVHIAFDRVFNSLQNPILQIQISHFTVTLEGKFWQKCHICKISCFYILTHRNQTKTYHNEIFAEKLPSDEYNRNVKQFRKNIWAEKNAS